SAYGSEGLPLHTDLTYIQDPPGLQIFTMVQPAPVGGDSVFCDGYAVAEKLKTINPDAFDILSNTIRTYHSKDNVTGWYLKASGPVIEVRDGQIVGIRHNDLDRLPDLPPNDLIEEKEIDEFYDNLKTAHAAWDALLAQDNFRLVMKLNPGDTMVVANQVSYIKQNLLHFYIQYNRYTT
ncbi:MAG: alpha-ketoglutarate-dependent taurine dioxygenase, partial [Bacillariaceae sp.]